MAPDSYRKLIFPRQNMMVLPRLNKENIACSGWISFFVYLYHRFTLHKIK